ncbi:MAG: CDP-alcohol phosphatidyltransferase family protein [Desulfobaccales bacterium]|nr:CDP-alcohol phosphatidyltransferase family protein [Desulfobaccales bacterium]
MVSRSYSRASLTIPNLITLARILLTPLFIIFLIQGCYRKALIVFLLAGLSDLADGLIARRWQQKSRLGSYLDPLADKLLISSSFVTLSIAHQIPPWLTVVVISRDVALALGVLLLRLAEYPLTIRPSLAGKWTATLQLATVLVVLVGKIWFVPLELLLGLFWLTGGLTALSGIQYLYRGLRMVSQSQENGRREGGRG